MKISDKDQAVLNILRQNARTNVTDIAEQLGVSRTTAQKRVQRLEESGIIDGYTVRLSPAFEDREVRANVSTIIEHRKMAAVISKIGSLSAVRAIYSVSGPYDLIVEIAAFDVRALDEVIDRIIAVDGVERTETSVILSTRLKR